MDAKQLGERGIIRLLTSKLRKSSAAEGFEDDAAFVKVGGKTIAITNDMGFGSTHFTSGDAEKMGRKIITSNASDLLAKGAIPKYALVAIGFPENTPASFLEKLYRGMDAELKLLGAYIIGGDTNKAMEFSYSVTMFGEVVTKKPLHRSSAKAGDTVLLTGQIGSAAAGFFMRKKNLRGPQEFLAEQDSPRLDYAKCRKIIKHASSGIDISDGLAFELGEMARVSGKKITIEWEKLPLHPKFEKFCRENALDEEEVALHHGEDYQVIYTSSKVGKGIPIGRVEKGRGIFLFRNGRARPLEARGYEHFKTN